MGASVREWPGETPASTSVPAQGAAPHPLSCLARGALVSEATGPFGVTGLWGIPRVHTGPAAPLPAPPGSPEVCDPTWLVSL